MNEFLPTDMYRTDAPDQAWKSLDQQSAEATAQRIDLSYLLHLEELKKGKQGWMERVIQRLELEGADAKRGAQVIADSVKVFKLFRTPAEHGGLGFSRERMTGVSFRKLRVFAQNKDWSEANRDRIPEMLDAISSEEKLREIIRAERGVTAKTATSDFTKFRFDVTLQDGLIVDDVLAAMTRARAFSGMPLPETDAQGRKLSEEYRRGVLIMDLLANWMTGDSGVTDEDGNEIPGMAFMNGGRYGEDNVQEPEEAVDAA